MKSKDPGSITAPQAKAAKEKIKQLEKENKLTGKALCDFIGGKSKAAGGLFEWILSTNDCYDIFKDVEPKRNRAQQLRKKAEESQEKLEQTQAKLEALTEKLR